VSKLKQFIHDHGTEALKLELERKKTFMNEKPERLKPFNSLKDIQQNEWDCLLTEELKIKNKFLYQKLMLTRFEIFEKNS
tara:strand:- start:577 stop:816 length:240 start_codon:yes stop_codon:yes gene_type:complete